jgi:hypothetical protein
MSKRVRRRSGKGGRWMIILAALVVAGFVLVLMAPSLIVNWVRGYVRQDSFKVKMEEFLGTKLHGETDLAPLRWTGDEVTSAEAQVITANGWHAELNGLHVGLDWNAFRAGAWRLVGSGADSLHLQYIPSKAAASLAPDEPVESLREPSPSGQDAPAWIRRWLPNRTEIEGATVERVTLDYPGPWRVRDARLHVSPWHQETSCQIAVDGGYLETPITLPAQPEPLKFNLGRATLRLSREQVLLNEATVQWLGTSEITLHGSLRPKDGEWKMSAHLADVPLKECLSEDWRAKFTGRLEGDLETHGARGIASAAEGDLAVRDGVITALPMLDRLATYTGVERFKRLVLDTATTHVKHDAANGTRLEKMVLQSNGLLRIEGTLDIQGRRIDGNFLLGVTQDTLRWFPGAQQYVFTLPNPQGPPGLLWTTLKISGTIDAPREDLSDRILAGAGKALLDTPGNVVNRGTELLLSPVVGKDAAAQPGAVLKGATDTLNKGVETGTKLIEDIGGALIGK